MKRLCVILTLLGFAGPVLAMDNPGAQPKKTLPKWVPSTEKYPEYFKQVPLLDIMHNRVEKQKLTLDLAIVFKKHKDVGPYLAALFVQDHWRKLVAQIVAITEISSLDEVELLEHAFAGYELVIHSLAKTPPTTLKHFQDRCQELIGAHGKKVIEFAKNATLETIDQGRRALKIIDSFGGMIVAMYANSSKDIVAARERMKALELQAATGAPATKQSLAAKLAAKSEAFVSALEALVPDIQNNTLSIGTIERIFDQLQRGTETIIEDTAALMSFCSRHQDALKKNGTNASFAEIESAVAGLTLIKRSHINEAGSKAHDILHELIGRYARKLRESVNETANKLPHPVLTRPEEPLLSELINARSLLDILSNANAFNAYDQQLYDKLTAAIEAPIAKPVSPSLSGTSGEKEKISIDNKEDPITETPVTTKLTTDPVSSSESKTPDEKETKKKNEKEVKASTRAFGTSKSSTKVRTTTTLHIDRHKLGIVLKWAAGLVATAAVIVGAAYYYKKQNTKPATATAG